MKKNKIVAGICAFILAVSLIAVDTLTTFAAMQNDSVLGAEEDKESELGIQKNNDGLVYLNDVLYNGYYTDAVDKLYSVKKGVCTLKTGALKAGTTYYSYNEKKICKLSKQTLYVNGKVYTGYYISNKNRMYNVKNGTYTFKTGTVKAGTRYYSYSAKKMCKLPKQTLYIKGKAYTGYYLDSSNKMYSVKNGIRILKDGTRRLKTGMLKAGTKYYSYNAKKTKKLSKQTLYVNGKAYTGYYTDNKNRMYRVKNGTHTLTNTTLKAGTKYYSSSEKKIQKLLQQTVYINGKKVKGMSGRSLATLQRAQAVVNKITNDSMTKEEKLKVCFDFVKTYNESRPRTPHYLEMDWPIVYANDMFINGTGNCCSYAAAFAYMAKAIGYEEVYCCNSGGHGWAEIDGLIYDPEWSKHHFVYNYYALSYDTKTDQNYKACILAGKPWMRIKL